LWITDEERKKYDVKARNIITYALKLNELYKISIYKIAKEIWEVLEVTHEGEKEVKIARKNYLEPRIREV